MKENKAKEFLKELGELLKKYHAEIGFTCADCSDTYGIYDPKISVVVGNKYNKYYTIGAGYWSDIGRINEEIEKEFDNEQ